MCVCCYFELAGACFLCVNLHKLGFYLSYPFLSKETYSLFQCPPFFLHSFQFLLRSRAANNEDEREEELYQAETQMAKEDMSCRQIRDRKNFRSILK